MTEKTRKILETIAAKNHTTPENVEYEMMEAIRTGMASPGPHAQALWKQICPDGKEPDLDIFLTHMANLVNMIMDRQNLRGNHADYLS